MARVGPKPSVDRVSKQIEGEFPELRSGTYVVTSEETTDYNCFAWAAGDQERWWGPTQSPSAFWPEGAPRSRTVDAYQAAYAHFGFHPCRDGTLELGIEKIALLAGAAGTPKHATRQLPSGRWTSKIGSYEDIEHDLETLDGGSYGRVVLFLGRPRGESR